MKYKFCSIRISVTKYEVTFATKGVVTSHSRVATPLQEHKTFWSIPKESVRAVDRCREEFTMQDD